MNIHHAIQNLLETADDTGCTEDLTVVSASALEELSVSAKAEELKVNVVRLCPDDVRTAANDDSLTDEFCLDILHTMYRKWETDWMDAVNDYVDFAKREVFSGFTPKRQP